MKKEERKDKDFIDVLQDLDNHSGSDLSGKKMTGLDLAGKDFSKCDLTGANFLNSNLSGCNFSSAKLDDTNFTGAHLSYTTWLGAKRNGSQIIKYASINIQTSNVNSDKSVYGFLVQNSRGKKVLINEPNIPEYEFVREKARTVTAMLYNLLTAEKW